MFAVGDPVRWTSQAGVPFAGTVRLIFGTTLQITCDPKRCGEDHAWHVAGASHDLEHDNPTLF